MQLKAQLSHFYHPVHDLKEGIKFFKDILGLKVNFSNLTTTTQEEINSDDVSNLQWVEFDAGHVVLLVQNVPSIVPYDTGIGFTVDNIDDAFIYFKNNDVDISRPIEGIQGKVRTFEIKDPTGSTFTIFGN